MEVHANASLTPQGRLTMVRRLEDENWTLAQAAEPEPRLGGNRQHDVPPADPGQLHQSGRRVGDVLKHFETEHEVEAVVLERQSRYVAGKEAT